MTKGEGVGGKGGGVGAGVQGVCEVRRVGERTSGAGFGERGMVRAVVMGMWGRCCGWSAWAHHASVTIA